ncbi:BsuPI-related putative proteinase inhibitor [Candidatus Latescibacterota bacterium]
MKKIMLFSMLLLLFISPVVNSNDLDYFPLDTGRVWVFDDGAVETITRFITVELPTNARTESLINERNKLNVFVFDAFNYEERMFFRTGQKIYEWTENHQRLLYDFNANEGDSWKIEWKSLSQEVVTIRDRRLSDINEGADMTLVEKNATVKTVNGTYSNCYHFKLSRPGVADAGYVEEWLAPGVGVVKRVWDTIAGPRVQLLSRLERPEPTARPYRIDVRLDKEVYTTGENIEIAVSVLNWSDEDVTLNFPTSLQIDYQIDEDYKYSENHSFTEAETEITIPARDIHKWTFTHTPEDFVVEPGRHTIIATLIGTELASRQDFIVEAVPSTLPAGLTATAATGSETYSVGETIDFSLTIANETDADIRLSIPDGNPLIYSIDDLVRETESLRDNPELIDIAVPANDAVVFEKRHPAANIMLKPGDYTLNVGIEGFGMLDDTQFTVSNDLTTSTISGTVVTAAEDEITVPVADARILMTPVIPREYERELSNIPQVTVTELSAITGNDGTYRIADIPLGMYYVIEVSKREFETYQRTLRILEAEVELNVTLKPTRTVSEDAKNFKRRLTERFSFAFGTGNTSYRTDSPFKAFLNVQNTAGTALGFTFQNENQLVVKIKDMNGTVIWESTSLDAADTTVEIAPGDTHVFGYEGTFAGIIPEGGGKFVIEGALNFSSTTLEDIDRDTLSGAVRVIIVPPDRQPKEPKRVKVTAHLREMVVDCREDLNTQLDVRMKDDDISGEINVTEILQNMHTERPNHRFVKMIEIDTDDTIRENMESATIRIYYNEEDFGEEFDPLRVVIAHWHEGESLDTDDEPDWNELETRVDTINRFVEATVPNFSSFALFESDDSPVVVEEEQPLEFSLSQNMPNPFNPTTLIQFTIPNAGTVRLTVYNIMGQVVERVVDEHMAAGLHNVQFNGTSLSSGIYFYQLESQGYSSARKMLLIK